MVAEHKDINDEDQTVHVPEIGTTATDIENKTHTFTYKTNVTILDTVAYENLIPGKTYSLEGTICNANTGEIYRDSKGNAYRETVEFIPTTASGTVEVIFKDVLVPYEKTKLVVFETLVLKEKGIVIAVHSDISDENQTVERPTAATSAMVDGNKKVWLKDGEVRNITITDDHVRVDYEKYISGAEDYICYKTRTKNVDYSDWNRMAYSNGLSVTEFAKVCESFIEGQSFEDYNAYIYRYLMESSWHYTPEHAVERMMWEDYIIMKCYTENIPVADCAVEVGYGCG